MPKVLDLRKKSVQEFQPTQEPKEEIKVAEKVLVKNKNPDITWEVPSFYYNPQKRYLSLLTIGLVGGATALLVFKQGTLTSIFLILSSLVLLLYANQKPAISKITVNQSGILIDDRIYRYKDLESFWIEYNPGGPKELSVESRKWYMPYIKVLLDEQNPVEIRSLVINFLPEKEHENSLADHIGKKLGL